MKKTTRDLKPLPAALYAGADVDVKLLKQLFEVATELNKFSKKIAKLIQREVPRHNQERLDLIGRHLPETRFRVLWYKQMDTKESYKRGWVPFFQLINDWVHKSVPELRPTDPETRKVLFLQDRDRREFVRPTAVPTLLEMTCNAGVDPRKTALFLWAYAEAAAWRDYEPAQFDVDRISLISADQPRMAEYCSKVNLLFQQPASIMADRAALEDDTHLADEEDSEYGLLASDGTQEGGAETRLSQRLPVLVKDSEPQGHDDRPTLGQSREVDEATPQRGPYVGDGTDSEYLSQLRDALDRVDGAWYAYLSKLDEVISAADELECMPSSSAIFGHMETSFSEMTAVRQSIRETMTAYSTLYEESLGSLGRDIIGRDVLLTSTASADADDVKQWLTQQRNDLELLSECETALIRYRDCATQLNAFRIFVRWEGPFDGLSALITSLELSVKDGGQLYRELERIERFRSHCTEASMNRDWTPFADDTLRRDGWKVLCSPLREVTVTPDLVGVALRVLLDTESPGHCSMIGHVLAKWNADLARTCETLSVLSRQQLERLWDDDTQMRPAVTLCVLNSWLNACDNMDPSRAEYWYWVPLKEASTRCEDQRFHISGSTHKFLQELKVLARKDGIRGSGSLRQLLAESGGEIDHIGRRVNQLYDQVKQRVLMRPHYGGNYGRLALVAYNELYSPLHDAILACDSDEVRRLLHELRAQFDFGDWFVRNSGRFERYGHIASEHKKKIQQYIDDRFDCLDEWLASKSHTTSAHDDQIRRVQSAAAELLAQYEQQGPHAPDEYLAMIGWWVNELRRGGDVPVLSAGNPSGALNTLLVPSTLIEEQGFPWRCIEAQVEESSPTWEMYTADALSWWSNPDVETAVLQRWQGGNRVECLRVYVQNCERQGGVVARELTQWLAERGEELKRALASALKEIQSKLEAFQSDTKQLLQEEFDDIKQGFDNEEWNDLMDRTELLREEVRSALERYGSDDRRQQLCEDISRLGGSACNESELAELEAERKKLLDAAKDRMVHITVLSNLLQLPELPQEIQDEIENVTQMLIQPRYLPEADRAVWLKCVLETVLSPLSDNLVKPDILLPEYRDLIFRFLWEIMKSLANPGWVVEQDSVTEKLLLQLSDKLDKEHSTDSVPRIKQNLEWLSTQSDGFGISNLDTDWIISTNKQEEQESVAFINQVATDKNGVSIEKARRILIDAVKNFSVGLVDAPVVGGDEQIEAALTRRNWDEVARLCVARLRTAQEEHLEAV